MRNLLAALFLLLSWLPCAAVTDTLDFAGLDRKLEEYLASMETLGTEGKIREVDFMLGSSPEGEVRNHVALKAYAHFLNSPVMGDEAVAVHLTDEWFSPGRAKMQDDLDLMNARVYAEFTRRSLVGKRAPSLRLETPSGDSREALGVESDTLAGGCSRLRVLFFYDTSCSKCAVESALLRTALADRERPLDFIAVYTGDDRAAWEKYMAERLSFQAPGLRVSHYWDPSLSSDFQRKYGVIQTPRIFLIGRDGTILGRNLDTVGLMKLLEVHEAEPVYGDEKDMAIFSAMFPPGDVSATADSIISVAGYIESRTLAELRDTVDYKRLTGNMLYYLSRERGEAFAGASEYVADSMVLARPDIWNTPSDTLNVVGLAEIVSSLADKARIGSRLPHISVGGTLLKGGRKTERTLALDRLAAGTHVVFYTRGCSGCEAELAGADALSAREPRTGIFLVDMDKAIAADSASAQRIFDAFDLSAMPFVMLVGRRHTVARKYFSLAGLSAAETPVSVSAEK